MKFTICCALLSLAVAAPVQPPLDRQFLSLAVEEPALAQVASHRGHATYTWHDHYSMKTKLSWRRIGLCGTIGLIAAVLTGAIIYCVMAGRRAPMPGTLEEMEEMRIKLLADLQKLDTIEVTDGKGAHDPFLQNDEGATKQDKAAEYDKMLTSLTNRAVEQLGPKFEKGTQMRDILDKRMASFKEKAKSFVLSEMNDTAGEVLKTVGQEEATLLLEQNEAVATHMPSSTVLLAGLLSPAFMKFMQVTHSLQVMLVHAPIFVLCTWGLYVDTWEKYEPCSVPSLFAWAYSQWVVAFLLLFGHLSLAIKIHLGNVSLRQKTQAMNARIERVKSGSTGSVGYADMHELFVCHTVLLQQGLFEEEKVRKSFLHSVVGLVTFVWLLISAWLAVLILGWIFVPGKTNFSDPTAGGDNYCGALALILTARVTSLLTVLFMFVNIGTVAVWISDMVVTSKAHSETMLKQAKEFDDANVGAPIAQTLVKAFVLRGEGEISGSKLNVTLTEKFRAEQDRGALQMDIASLDKRIAKLDEEANILQPTANQGFDANIAKLEGGALDPEQWKAKGKEATEEARKLAAEEEQPNTEQLEEMMGKINAAATAVQESESFKSAVDEGKKRASQVQARASQLGESALTQAAQVQARASQLGQSALDKMQQS